jgi:hypothetical protein
MPAEGFIKKIEDLINEVLKETDAKDFLEEMVDRAQSALDALEEDEEEEEDDDDEDEEEDENGEILE